MMPNSRSKGCNLLDLPSEHFGTLEMKGLHQLSAVMVIFRNRTSDLHTNVVPLSIRVCVRKS